MAVPQFADKIAPVPTTHNPKTFFVVSFIALLANVALIAYQIIEARRTVWLNCQIEHL